MASSSSPPLLWACSCIRFVCVLDPQRLTDSLPGAKLSRPAFPVSPCAAVSPPHRSSASPLYCLSSLGRFATGSSFMSFSRSRRVISTIPASHRSPVLYRWLRTWTMEYRRPPPLSSGTLAATTSIPPTFLPRAFDSPQQRAQTIALIAEYNQTNSISAVARRPLRRARRRTHSRPSRSATTSPCRSCATPTCCSVPAPIEFYLDVFWWHWSEHPVAIRLGHPARPHQSLLCRRCRLGIPSPPRALAVDAGRLSHLAFHAPRRHGKSRAPLHASVFPHPHRRRRCRAHPLPTAQPGTNFDPRPVR